MYEACDAESLLTIARCALGDSRRCAEVAWKDVQDVELGEMEEEDNLRMVLKWTSQGRLSRLGAASPVGSCVAERFES